MSVPAQVLVDLAMAVPAVGDEADDWRARNLSELLLQALVTGDQDLVAGVDAAAGTVPAVCPRFADRLRDLRERLGPVPGRYPGHRVVRGAVAWPGESTRRHAAALARLADRSSPGPPATTPAPASAREVAADLDRGAGARVLGHTGHRCVDVALPADLVWREWLMDDATATLAVTSKQPGPAEDAQRPGLQLHMGTHLDHLTELSHHRGPAEAHRLQFGTGLLIAESVAMTGELLALIHTAADSGALRASLHHLVIDRLSRLPGIAQWGEQACAGSGTMNAAIGAASAEFAALPTLAGTYINGPFTLAAHGFTHPLIPPRLRSALQTRWTAAFRRTDRPGRNSPPDA